MVWRRERLAQHHTDAYVCHMSVKAAKPSAIREHRKVRLCVEDWVAAGFRALVADGPSGLKVEPLSRSLGTTKGSFYWHFADLADLRTHMIELWRRLGEAEITAAVRSSGLKGGDALSILINRISVSPHATFGGAGVEPAIRAWALENDAVAHAVAQVDRLRLEVVQTFLMEAGLPLSQARQSAQIFYASFLGLGILRLSQDVDVRAGLQAQLSALISAPKVTRRRVSAGRRSG